MDLLKLETIVRDSSWYADLTAKTPYGLIQGDVFGSGQYTPSFFVEDKVVKMALLHTRPGGHGCKVHTIPAEILAAVEA